MPYTVKKGEGCPTDKPYAVVSDRSGRVLGCHGTSEKAARQVAHIMESEREKKQENAHEWSERMRAILSTHDVCFGLSLVRLGDVELIAEVAERTPQWKMGLKHRPKMRYDAMLFKFNTPQQAQFTMTDVNFDLDVFWFDADKNLIGKTAATAGAPFVETPPNYVYALEVPAAQIDVPENVQLSFT